MISFTGKKADITVSLSEGVRTDLIDNFRYPPEKVKTIYNSCDISWFMVNNSNIDKIIEKTSFNGHCVVTVGRLTNQKGQWHLIKAISCVKKKIPDVQLFLFGEGELLDSLKALTEELNLSENIVFMGYVKNHHKFMAKCDCFVFPSIYEGLGNVVLEALACGIPVISTDCPYGPKEILDPNNVFEITNKHDGEYGVLVPAFQDEGMDFSLKIEKNEEILANAIIEILTDKGKKEWYRAQAIRRSIFFKPENIQHQWIDLIEEVRQ